MWLSGVQTMSKLTTSYRRIGNSFTQRIERENLTLRNRIKRLNRKTLGYSKSPEMYDKVIGTSDCSSIESDLFTTKIASIFI